MTRTYHRLTPAKKLALRIAFAAVPAIGARHLAELFGVSHPQFYSAIRPSRPIGLLEVLPKLHIAWIQEFGGDFSDWAPALLDGIGMAFVVTEDALPADQRPKAWSLPADEIEKLVRLHYVNPASAQEELIKIVAKIELNFDRLNRMIGCRKRSAGRRAA